MKSDLCEIQITRPLPMWHKNNKQKWSGPPSAATVARVPYLNLRASARIFFVRLPETQLQRASGQAFPAEAISTPFASALPYVGTRDQLPDQLQAGRMLDVDANAAFVAIEGRKEA
jgi:hypothetical protein